MRSADPLLLITSADNAIAAATSVEQGSVGLYVVHLLMWRHMHLGLLISLWLFLFSYLHHNQNNFWMG
jgi:hypothetical protein